MNTKVKKSIFWAALMSPVVIAICFLSGGKQALAFGPHGGHRGFREHGGFSGQGQMGPQGGGFSGHAMMNGTHHGGGFPFLGVLLLLMIGLAIAFFLVKWLKKKAKSSNIHQLIDTSLVSGTQPIINQNASILDQWEKEIIKKKEND